MTAEGGGGQEVVRGGGWPQGAGPALAPGSRADDLLQGEPHSLSESQLPSPSRGHRTPHLTLSTK